jgi:hypothetical protein
VTTIAEARGRLMSTPGVLSLPVRVKQFDTLRDMMCCAARGTSGSADAGTGAGAGRCRWPFADSRVSRSELCVLTFVRVTVTESHRPQRHRIYLCYLLI